MEGRYPIATPAVPVQYLTLDPESMHGEYMKTANTNTITDAQLADLRIEAGAAGDIVQIVLCDRATGEDIDAEDYSGGGHSHSEMEDIRAAARMTPAQARLRCAQAVSWAQAQR